jgi:N-acetylneuraminic acid mutarotase
MRSTRTIAVILSLPAAVAAAGCGDSPGGPSAGGWRTLASMPAARQEIATAVLDGRIYVIGGFNGAGQSTNDVFVYNPQANSWSEAASLPIANNHGAAAVASGQLFAFGGVSNRVFVYNPAGNSWSEVASMNFEHGNTAAVAVINNRIYVAGGTGPGATQREVEVYDPNAGTWTPLAGSTSSADEAPPVRTSPLKSTIQPPTAGRSGRPCRPAGRASERAS